MWLKKIAILAERTAEAGLTQEEAFPMMKNQPSSLHFYAHSLP
jgi:hypothetical protein